MHLPTDYDRSLPGGPSPPHGCGKRLIPQLVDERALAGHVRPLYSIHDPVSDCFCDISYAQFANAVNHCSHWILSAIGRSLIHETLVYLGPGDLRYQIFTLAAIKTGHVVCFRARQTPDWMMLTNHPSALCSLAS